MTESDGMVDAARYVLWQQGWRTYRPVSLTHLDCVHLRSVEDHLGAVVQLMGALTWTEPGAFMPQLTGAWLLAEQWLRMAAGLEHIEINLSSFDAPCLCGIAMDYEESANRAASLFIGEYTRLLYTSNATEVLLNSMDLAQVNGATSVFARATARITASFDDALPSHYRGILRHLRDHIRRDPYLRSDKGLTRALEERPWRGESALLLSASQQLRNVLAHGALRVPQPDRWDREEDHRVEPIALQRLHVPRLGVRGLLLGLQMIVGTLLPDGCQLPVSELRSPWTDEQFDGAEDAPAQHLFLVAHLAGDSE